MIGANIGLIALAIIAVLFLAAILYKETVLDFVKANFAMILLVYIFLVLLAVSFHIFHEQSGNPLAKDFLAWIEQKAGEVLAGLLAVLTTARNTKQRSGDSGSGNGASGPIPASVSVPEPNPVQKTGATH